MASKKDFLNFLNIANRSLVETEYLLEVARELNYLEQNKFDELYKLRREVGLRRCENLESSPPRGSAVVRVPLERLAA